MKKLKYVIFIVTLVLCGCSNQTLSDDIEDIDDSFIKDCNEAFNSEDEVVNFNEEEAILITLSDDNPSNPQPDHPR